MCATRRPSRVWLGLPLLLAGVIAAIAPIAGATKATYVIGAKSFSEQYILAELMADRIEQKALPRLSASGSAR